MGQGRRPQFSLLLQGASALCESWPARWSARWAYPPLSSVLREMATLGWALWRRWSRQSSECQSVPLQEFRGESVPGQRNQGLWPPNPIRLGEGNCRYNAWSRQSPRGVSICFRGTVAPIACDGGIATRVALVQQGQYPTFAFWLRPSSAIASCLFGRRPPNRARVDFQASQWTKTPSRD